MFEHFHFLRPSWLLLTPLLPLLGFFLWRLQRRDSGWQRLIQPDLLRHLLDGSSRPASRWPLLALLAGWLLCLLALAGPSWEKLPQPLFKKQDALVIILDLSPSMMAQDLKPSRLVHARHTLIDLLKARTEGVTGLIVYAGDAHVLSPLSSDRQTLLTLAPTLSPEIMPLPGSQSEAAVRLGIDLLKEGGYQQGHLLLITDELAPRAQSSIAELLGSHAYPLSIIGVGSETGAPIPLKNGSFAKDNRGGIVIAQLNRDELQRVAASSGGIYRDMSFDDRDISAILNHLGQGASGETRLLEREFDLWSDAGPWLVLLLLPLAALSHRRGWLVLILLMPMSVPDNAYALGWEDLWLTKNQQGAKALQRGETEAAAQLFDRPQWRGSAQYLNGDYNQAAISFLQTDDADAHYNRGNALAHSGELESALQAFDKALELEPGMDDAEFNRQLVQQRLDQQSESEGEGEGSGQQDQQNADQQDSDQENQSRQGTNRQNASQNRSDPSSSTDNGKPQDQAASNAPKTPTDQSEEESNKPAQDKKQPSDQTKNPSESPQQTSREATEQNTQVIDIKNKILDTPQDASLDKWLQQLPEDPGGLLRRKFDYEYRQKLEAYRRGDWQPADEIRW